MSEKILTPSKLNPRARYFDVDWPEEYFDLNHTAFDLAILDLLATDVNKLAKSLDAAAEMAYHLHADELDVGEMVKVVPLPIEISPELTQGLIQEMRDLRAHEMLTPLRGGRKTELARPLKPETRAYILRNCPHIVDLIIRVENKSQGNDLFIRALKFDEARASTTQVDADRKKANPHFDAEKSPLSEYRTPVYQFYANLGQEPRQFQIIPEPLPQILNKLVAGGYLSPEQRFSTRLEEVMNLYLAHFSNTYETVIVKSGKLAIFNGRNFIHDAGKGKMSEIMKGNFEPTDEPDILLALDTPHSGEHIGYYDPQLSFLDDPGTPEWWKIMAEVEKAKAAAAQAANSVATP